MKTFTEFISEVSRPMRPFAGRVSEIILGPVKLKLYYDPDIKEYVIRWIENGKWDENKSYHTNDLDDAVGTMHLMAQKQQTATLDQGMLDDIDANDTIDQANSRYKEWLKIRETEGVAGTDPPPFPGEGTWQGAPSKGNLKSVGPVKISKKERQNK